MKTFDQTVRSLVSFLENDPSCKVYRFRYAFPDTTVRNPIEKILVSVGIASMRITQSTLDEGIGDDGSYLRGRQMELDFRLRIYVPHYKEGSACHEVCSDLVSALLERQSEWKIGEIRCQEVEYHRDTRTFCQECRVTVQTQLQFET